MRGLNLGCGPLACENDFIEWENSDAANNESSLSWPTNSKRDFTMPFDDLEDESIDFIIGWHIIEHIGLKEQADVLIEWYRVLKPGGKLFLACPDITKIAQNIVNRQGPWEDWFICMVNVYGPFNGYVGDYHKWGYDEEQLIKLLTNIPKGDKSFSEAHVLYPDKLHQEIGYLNGPKFGFADYNAQVYAVK